jgi:hypothetical protein
MKIFVQHYFIVLTETLIMFWSRFSAKLVKKSQKVSDCLNQYGLGLNMPRVVLAVKRKFRSFKMLRVSISIDTNFFVTLL